MHLKCGGTLFQWGAWLNVAKLSAIDWTTETSNDGRRMSEKKDSISEYFGGTAIWTQHDAAFAPCQ